MNQFLDVAFNVLLWLFPAIGLGLWLHRRTDQIEAEFRRFRVATYDVYGMVQANLDDIQIALRESGIEVRADRRIELHRRQAERDRKVREQVNREFDHERPDGW